MVQNVALEKFFTTNYQDLSLNLREGPKENRGDFSCMNRSDICAGFLKVFRLIVSKLIRRQSTKFIYKIFVLTDSLSAKID